GDAREEIAALCPDWMRLAVGLPPEIATAPSAPARIAIAVEAVSGEAEKSGRVAFHNEGELQIELAERPLGANIRFEPMIRYRASIGAHTVAVVHIAADPRPGRRSVFAAIWTARLDDVMQIGEFAANPWPGVVLIRNRINAEFGEKAVNFGAGA